MNVHECIAALPNMPNFFSREEIDAAKRKLSLPALMKLVGDGGFVSDRSIASPFHPSERPTFRLYRRWRRIVFECCKTCGYEGDQIDYLKARYQLGTGQAIALFCKLAGVV